MSDTREGTIYTIRLFRSNEEDSPESHGSALSGTAQVAAELQEAIEGTGLPVGEFRVVSAQPASALEWAAVWGAT